eukprot:2285908-Amphidinium_carterae.1
MKFGSASTELQNVMTPFGGRFVGFDTSPGWGFEVSPGSHTALVEVWMVLRQVIWPPATPARHVNPLLNRNG